MWSDNVTNCDFLNFRTVADTVAEMIIQAQGCPLSMGISGGWGAGKSSMIKFIEEALRERGNDKFLFVDFNAWLYQGYDDARAALMDVIVQRLSTYAEEKKTGLDKVHDLIGRIDWLRAAGLVAGSTISLVMGLPPIGAIGEAWGAVRRLTNGQIEQADIDKVTATSERVVDAAKSLDKSKKIESPPKQIQDLRDHFQATLKELNVTLIVLVDDLDRCLPNTAIATLEAIRLFLFLENTAFIIAADDKMIRQAVRAHFKETTLDDDLVTNYFDKLIQVPIRVPPLGTQDVRAYLMLLFVMNSNLPEDKRNIIRERVCKQLGESWQGKRVDRTFVSSLIEDCPKPLVAQLELADRLAPLMTTAKQIAGNPRLIKRFLNTLSIRLDIAQSQHITVDEAAVAKMLLFERCASEYVYAALVKAINDSDGGKPAFLKPWEQKVLAGQELSDLEPKWNTEFIKDWLAVPPQFGDLDLRSVVYVSREHLPIITAEDRLSSDGAELLAALLEVKNQTITPLSNRLKKLPQPEIGLIMDRLLVRARQIQEWGTPPILYACLTVIDADPNQSEKLVIFLRQVAGSRLRTPLIPVLGGKKWAKELLIYWQSLKDTPDTVKKAIKAEQKEV